MGLARYARQSAHGSDGVDYVVTYSTMSFASGDDGNDAVEGLSSTNNADVLTGGNGADCLTDASGSWTTFDCGAGTDWNTEYSLTGTSNCEANYISTCVPWS